MGANGKNQTLSVQLGNTFTPAQVAAQPTKVEFPTGQEAGNGMKPEFCKFVETMFRLFNQPMPSAICQQKQEHVHVHDGGSGWRAGNVKKFKFFILKFKIIIFYYFI